MGRYIHVEPVKVPNPLALKFETPALLLTPGAYEYPDAASAQASPLAAMLFKLSYVRRVFIAKNFVTVTKESDEPTWDAMMGEVRVLIKKHLEEGLPLFNFDHSATPEAEPLGDELLEGIRSIIEGQVQQATWQDGGEIYFESFADGEVRVKLAGACIGCPFAPRTLKHGVEVLLKRHFPEVASVTSADVDWANTQLA